MRKISRQLPLELTQSFSVSDDFSDSGWWPTAIPEPPKQISTATIVLGTIVPIAVIAMLVLALVTHKSHSKAPARSLAAFQSCLGDQGVMTSSAESNDALLRQAAIACRAHVPLLPTGVDETRAAQQQLENCQKAAASKLRNSAPEDQPVPRASLPPGLRECGRNLPCRVDGHRERRYPGRGQTARQARLPDLAMRRRAALFCTVAVLALAARYGSDVRRSAQARHTRPGARPPAEREGRDVPARSSPSPAPDSRSRSTPARSRRRTRRRPSPSSSRRCRRCSRRS